MARTKSGSLCTRFCLGVENIQLIDPQIPDVVRPVFSGIIKKSNYRPTPATAELVYAICQ